MAGDGTPARAVEILFVSKAVAPPWNDSSKNLVRDLASALTRHRAVVLSTREAAPALSLGHAAIEPIYPAASAYAPSIAQNARVLRRLLAGRRADLWHFFFAPNPRTSRFGALASRLRRVRTVQTVCTAPRDDLDPRPLLFADRTVVLSPPTESRLHAAGVPPERVVRIPPCVAPLEPHDDARRRATRAALGLPPDRPLVVYPGDLEFGA